MLIQIDDVDQSSKYPFNRAELNVILAWQHTLTDVFSSLSNIIDLLLIHMFCANVVPLIADSSLLTPNFVQISSRDSMFGFGRGAVQNTELSDQRRAEKRRCSCLAPSGSKACCCIGSNPVSSVSDLKIENASRTVLSRCWFGLVPL